MVYRVANVYTLFLLYKFLAIIFHECPQSSPRICDAAKEPLAAVGSENQTQVSMLRIAVNNVYKQGVRKTMATDSDCETGRFAV